MSKKTAKEQLCDTYLRGDVFWNTIFYIHQLPQNILGLLVILFTRSKKSDDCTYYQSTNKKLNFGVSLGEYIIFGYDCYDLDSWFHEAGHGMQSIYLGWLYLIVVGLPSILRNIWDILFHKNWSNEERNRWYYSGYPEKWADKLGGVDRCLKN